MLKTRLGWFGCLFIAGAMMMGAVLMLGMRRGGLSRTAPTVNPEQAAESYRHRVQETESILEGGEYDVPPQ